MPRTIPSGRPSPSRSNDTGPTASATSLVKPIACIPSVLSRAHSYWFWTMTGWPGATRSSSKGGATPVGELVGVPAADDPDPGSEGPRLSGVADEPEALLEIVNPFPTVSRRSTSRRPARNGRGS